MASGWKVWIHAHWIGRKTKCAVCDIPMHAGERSVTGSYRSTEGQFGRQFWHLQCYMKQLEWWFEEHPFVPRVITGRGRKPLNLTKEQRMKRRSLIVRFSLIRSEKFNCITAGLLTRLPELEEKAREIMKQMEEIGGVPNSWTGRRS